MDSAVKLLLAGQRPVILTILESVEWPQAFNNGRILPKDIRIATVWYRPSDKTLRTPDYFVHETEDWLALPYELSGMSPAELIENRPELAPIIERLRPFIESDEDKPAA